MNLNFVELANFIQIIPYEKKKQTYQIYREFIPNQKVYLKYIKSKIKGKNKGKSKRNQYKTFSSEEENSSNDSIFGTKGKSNEQIAEEAQRIINSAKKGAGAVNLVDNKGNTTIYINREADFYFMVCAERKDIDKLEVEPLKV